MGIARPLPPSIPDVPDDFAEGPRARGSIGSRSEPEARASPGPCLRLVLSSLFVDSSRPRGGPSDYWAGQRTTGGPVGTSPAAA